MIAVSASTAMCSVLKRKADRCIMIDKETEGQEAYFYKDFIAG